MKSLFKRKRGLPVKALAQAGDIASVLTLIALGLMTIGIGVGTWAVKSPTSPFYSKAATLPIGVSAGSVTPQMVDEAGFTDGFVDVKDYEMVVAHYETQGAIQGDVNKDTITNGLDLSIVIMHIGKEAK